MIEPILTSILFIEGLLIGAWGMRVYLYSQHPTYFDKVKERREWKKR